MSRACIRRTILAVPLFTVLWMLLQPGFLEARPADCVTCAEIGCKTCELSGGLYRCSDCGR